MRGEFIGVWSEARRDIWQPLIDQFLLETEDGAPEDLFCELYREVSKVLCRPADERAVELLLGDAIALREVFEGTAYRAKPDLAYEAVKAALENSGAEGAAAADERRALLEAALLGLLGQPGTPHMNELLVEHARDAARVNAAWKRAVEKTINDPQVSRMEFEKIAANDIAGERALVGFFESVHGTLEQFEKPGDDALSNRYFNLLTTFIEKFSLRYDLRRPCILCPTLPGLFASLVRHLRALTAQDPHLDKLLKEYEESVRDLRLECSDGRIRSCIGKQFMLLEALGALAPGVTKGSLGEMCDELNSWPHPTVRESLKKPYGFASDYPGIRHGSNRKGAVRDIDMRDMVALSILLAGFTPYLTNVLNPDVVYRGA